MVISTSVIRAYAWGSLLLSSQLLQDHLSDITYCQRHVLSVLIDQRRRKLALCGSMQKPITIPYCMQRASNETSVHLRQSVLCRGPHIPRHSHSHSSLSAHEELHGALGTHVDEGNSLPAWAAEKAAHLQVCERHIGDSGCCTAIDRRYDPA